MKSDLDITLDSFFNNVPEFEEYLSDRARLIYNTHPEYSLCGVTFYCHTCKDFIRPKYVEECDQKEHTVVPTQLVQFGKTVLADADGNIPNDRLKALAGVFNKAVEADYGIRIHGSNKDLRMRKVDLSPSTDGQQYTMVFMYVYSFFAPDYLNKDEVDDFFFREGELATGFVGDPKYQSKLSADWDLNKN
jgi:hypothetical protein